MLGLLKRPYIRTLPSAALTLRGCFGAKNRVTSVGFSDGDYGKRMIQKRRPVTDGISLLQHEEKCLNEHYAE